MIAASMPIPPEKAYICCMDLDRHATNHAVREILDGIVQDLPGYRWERICAFSDGKGKTIVEVSVYRRKGQELAAVLSYQVETGEMLEYRYQVHPGPAPESLIDLLLDIRNLEYSLQTGNV